MARASRLKLFRTPMGFFDAVVAAPSQAVALKAWGVTANLFTENLAEEVRDDAALLAEASKSPGVVLRKPRGAPEKILAAPSPPKRRKAEPAEELAAKERAAKEKAAPSVQPSPSKPVKPKDRSKLDAAEAALAQAKERLADELLAIDDEREELDAREAEARDRGREAIHAAEQRVKNERAALAS